MSSEVRPNWDITCYELAAVIAKRAACTRSQVGAVLLSADKLRIFVGYNGVGPGLRHCSDGGCERGKLTYAEKPPLGTYETCSAIHAENNAVTRAGEHANGAILYVTRAPCSGCMELALDAGVKEIKWRT